MELLDVTALRNRKDVTLAWKADQEKQGFSSFVPRSIKELGQIVRFLGHILDILASIGHGVVKSHR